MKLYSVDEVAKILGISTNQVRIYCQTGRLGQKVSSCWVITEENLEQFQKTRKKSGRPRKKPAE
jgi:predicted ArsR family transcriptional regulator